MNLFELLFFILVLYIGIGTCTVVTSLFNIWAGVPAAFLSLVVFFKSMDFLRRMSRRRHHRKMAEKYPRIFRVLTFPVNEKDAMKLISAKNHAVKIGDYGWEAKPFSRRATDRKGNLIYLKGWNENWNLIWYSGFLPNEIEYVGQKPFSEYDLPNPPAPRPLCPFPVQPRGNAPTVEFAN
jgi:hypothetical protein